MNNYLLQKQKFFTMNKKSELIILKNSTDNLINSLKLLYPIIPQTKIICAEIGSFEGEGSIIINNYLCNNFESKLYCIDPFDDEYVKGNKNMSFWNSACNGQLNRFRNNTKNFPKIIECKEISDTMIPKLEDNTINFAYIDGDHSPEQVYKDAINIFKKMKKDGIILFDDYLWEINGIKTRIGIDKFLDEYNGKYNLLFKDYQLAISII